MFSRVLFAAVLMTVFVNCSSPMKNMLRGPAEVSRTNLVVKTSEIVEKLQSRIFSEKITINEREEYFDMVAYLGTHITSSYFLSLYLTNDIPQNPYYSKKLQEHLNILRKMQNRNGGWYRVLDSNLEDSSDPSATLTHYLLFKASGESLNSPLMLKAYNYLSSQGGYQKIDAVTKFILSLFGNYAWSDFPYIPYLIFNRSLPINDGDFAAWLSPHLLPLSILRNLQASRFLGENFLLDEFYKKSIMNKDQYKIKIKKKDYEMILKLMKEQRPKGSWGGYVIASIFGRIVLKYSKDSQYPFSAKERQDLNVKIKLTESFLNKYLFDAGSSSFLGATQDGHVWDTALLGVGLFESKVSVESLQKSLSHLAKMQSPNGGFPFGYDFENTPDVDDTAIVLLALSYDEKRFKDVINQGLKFLSKMQNDDGGFAAFSKNNNGNFLLTFLTRSITDTTDLYDESSPDVTAHVLEALGKYQKHDDQKINIIIDKAINYLKKYQEQDGSFYGRWGVNYLYSTGAVLSGLKSVGVSFDDSMVLNSISWLKTVQNPDGGFGESTVSYSRSELKGVGKSTTTQTAFALIGLLSYLPANDPSVIKAVKYLINEFDYQQNVFHETSVTGTGHPNVCYMTYPAYAFAFPLIALSRYINKASK